MWSFPAALVQFVGGMECGVNSNIMYSSTPVMAMAICLFFRSLCEIYPLNSYIQSSVRVLLDLNSLGAPG